MSPPLANSSTPNHKTPSQKPYIPRTQTSIARLQFPASVPFFASDFTLEPSMSHNDKRLHSFITPPLKPNVQQKTWLRLTKIPSATANSRHVIHLEFTD